MNNEKKKPELPIAICLVEAEKDINSVINSVVDKYRIPFYLIEPMVTNAARQVSAIAEKERRNAMAEYEKQLEEYEKGGADNEHDGSCNADN